MSSHERQAFTLVELILAIALTAVLLVVISTAIEVQMHAFQSATRKTDRGQMVLALLQRVAADLHGALGPAPTQQDATTGTSSGEGADETGTDDSAASLADELESTLSSSIGDTSSGAIGLRGESDHLWIDVIRARPSDPNASDTIAWFADVPVPEESGIRTILYYVVASEDSTAPEDTDRANARAGGLVRREFVEPVASYARQLGLLEELDTSVRPLAAEVIGITFRYHDGDDWCDTWDSATTGELPRAVEITLLFASDDALASGSADPSVLPLSTDDALADAITYRLVVSLPIETPDAGSGSTGGSTPEAAESTSILDDSDAIDPSMEDEP